MTTTTLPASSDLFEQARVHGLCTYSLATLGWRCVGGLTVREAFRHSNGQLGVYSGDEAGYLDEQPLLGRHALIWLYDEWASEHGPFVCTGDSADFEVLTDALTDALGGDRTAVEEALGCVPAATVCGSTPITGSGSGSEVRCFVHVGLPVIHQDSDPVDRARVEKVIRSRQASETFERHLLDEQ